MTPGSGPPSPARNASNSPISWNDLDTFDGPEFNYSYVADMDDTLGIFDPFSPLPPSPPALNNVTSPDGIDNVASPYGILPIIAPDTEGVASASTASRLSPSTLSPAVRSGFHIPGKPRHNPWA